MTKRKKIGILYDYNENWIGSTYYIQNLISALNVISDNRRPEILIIAKTRGQFEKLIKSTGYPYLSYKPFGLLERIANRLLSNVPGRRIISKLLWPAYSKLDLIFPATHGLSFAGSKNALFWVADFQEHYLPAFFSQQEIQKRKAVQQKIVDHGKRIVLSSKAARADFNEIYPGNKLRQFVLPFAVTHPPLHHVSVEEISKKFNIPSPYFICSNQFWKHKNHAVILRALALLKRSGHNFFVAFTGKIHDYRNPQYFEELGGLLQSLDIEKNVGFLGFISREDQLTLMNNSIAVVQPSLFEGWSTVVEDAKSLQVKIVVSDISVHREQLESYDAKWFFSPEDEEQLAESLKLANTAAPRIQYNYGKDILRYGTAFADIMEIVATNQPE